MGQELANIHGDSAGAEGDQRTVPATVVELAETGAGEPHHQNHQPARIAQRLNLRKALLHIFIIQQLMLGHNHNMLHFRHHVHVNAAIDVFTRRGQALAVFNRGEHNRIRGDGAFNAVHAERPPQTSRELLNQRALCAML